MTIIFKRNEQYDNCDSVTSRIQDCKDLCRARIMAASCRDMCIPITWESVLPKDQWTVGKHCTIEDYNECLDFNLIRHQADIENCAQACLTPCKETDYRLSLIYQGKSMKLLLKNINFGFAFHFL